MPRLSLEELKRLVRKIEFNKTEPELLVELIQKAKAAGEEERTRLKRITKKSQELFKLLKQNGLLCPIDVSENTLKTLRNVPVGSVDGSFQVTGGRSGLWYVIIGVSQVLAEHGFTVHPKVLVDGIVEPIEAIDEADAKREAEKLMMLAEIKAMLRTVEPLKESNIAYLFIDGPIIDPPWFSDKKYIEKRVNALKFCMENNIIVIGFVKRILGRKFINFLKNILEESVLDDYINDFDLLTSVLFNAVKEENGIPVYTKPTEYDEKLSKTYNLYKEKELLIYYSYYKPHVRGGVYCVELASSTEIDEENLLSEYQKIMSLIRGVWTLPGLMQPLPIMIAHTKCNVRKGAADTLYYEIMTRAFSEGITQSWVMFF